MVCWHGVSFPSLLLILLTNHVCLAQHSQCNYTSSLDNTINVTNGLSKGLKSLSPFYTDTVEKCLNRCCSDLPITGGQLCNFMTFAPKENSSPNCYLFHCPNKDACPTKYLKGYTSYVVEKDQELEKSAMTSHSQNGEGSSDGGTAADLRGSGSDLSPGHESAVQSTTTTHRPLPTVQSGAQQPMMDPTLPPPNVLPTRSSTAAPVTTTHLLVTTTSPVTTSKSPAATVQNSLSLTSAKTVPTTGLPVVPSTSTRTAALPTTQSLKTTALQTTTTEPTTTSTLPTTIQTTTTKPTMTSTLATTIHPTTTEPTTTSTLPTTIQTTTIKPTMTSTLATTIHPTTTEPTMTSTLPTTLQATTTEPTVTSTPATTIHPTTTEPTMTSTLPTTLQATTTEPSMTSTLATTTIPPPMPTTFPTTLQASTTESKMSTTLPTTSQTTTTQSTITTTLPSTLHTTRPPAVITTHPTSTTTLPNTTASTSRQPTTSWTMSPLPATRAVTTTVRPTTSTTTTISAVSTRKSTPRGNLQPAATRVPDVKTPFLTNIPAVSNNAGVNKKDGGEQDQRQSLGGQEESAGKFGNSQMEVKSGLIAALGFGMLFLTIVVVILSKQIIHSYKRRDYIKMDYLMNGIYVDA